MKTKIIERKSSPRIIATKKFIALIVTCMFTVTLLNAQTPAPNGLAAPPPPPGLQPGIQAPPPAPDNQQLQQVSTYKGNVVKMNLNDDYVYDGFYMLNNGDSVLVKFPPHLGTQITGAVKTGSSVSVSGVMNVSPIGVKEIRMISITSGSNTIADTAAPMATQPLETYTNGNGKITQLQTNREGMVNGLIVDNKTVLRIPPHIANQLQSIAQLNSSVAYTGMKKTSSNGEVSAGDYMIVHCRTITINGQQYLVQ